MRRWFSLVLLVLAVLVGSLLGVLNPTPVTVDLLFIQLQIPLGLALSMSLVTGLLLGALALWIFQVLPLRARLRRAKKSLPDDDRAQQEKLEAIPHRVNAESQATA